MAESVVAVIRVSLQNAPGLDAHSPDLVREEQTIPNGRDDKRAGGDSSLRASCDAATVATPRREISIQRHVRAGVEAAHENETKTRCA